MRSPQKDSRTSAFESCSSSAWSLSLWGWPRIALRVRVFFALVSKGRVDQATGTVLGLGAKLGPLATQLVKLALDQEGLIVFRDERREGYASVRLDRGRRTVALGSREFGAWLRELAWGSSLVP